MCNGSIYGSFKNRLERSGAKGEEGQYKIEERKSSKKSYFEIPGFLIFLGNEMNNWEVLLL
jgi:hypothetical protein